MDSISSAEVSRSERIVQGQAVAYFAFDIGYEVSLEKVRQLLPSLPIQPISRKKKTPTYLQYANAPQVLDLGEFRSDLFGKPGQIQATIFDFGAVSISYRWPLTSDAHPALSLADLPRLSKSLFDAKLETHARESAQSLMTRLAPAITRPELSALEEDYFVFVLESLEHPLTAEELLNRYREPIAQALRFDTEPLSQDLQEEALSRTISYYERDVVLIDWNTAVVYDTDYADTLSVLELTNVELLEARYIDTQLDLRLSGYDDLIQKQPPTLLPLYSPYRSAINELAALRVEYSLLSERVDNALKLIGDLYLARVHNIASERFGMYEWDTAISRKLEIVGNLYQLLTDRTTSAQTQTLEVVIVVLIFIEIVMGVLK